MINDREAALDTIHRLAIEHELKTATAESLTSGLISGALAERSGSSAYHQGGIVAYNIDTKVGLLAVDREMAASCNCVSADVAMHMALGAQAAFEADLIIAVTGYAEPWPEAGADRPFALYTILCGGASASGEIDLGGLDRNAAREKVVTDTLCGLATVLVAAFEG